MDDVIHFSDYASQPDVRIACDYTWGRPWGENAVVEPNDEDGEGGIYQFPNGKKYTFTESCVTCEDCKEYIRRNNG